MKPQTTLRRALEDPHLLGSALGGPSWAGWRSLLLASLGEALQPDELEWFRRLTKREASPSERIAEAWFCIGRRGGKTNAIGALITYLGALCSYPMLKRGETGYVISVAPDRDQAAGVLNYAHGIFENSPILRPLIARRTSDELELTNGIVIAVKTASFRRLRGFTACGIILEESAFYYDDTSANPDTEILAAARPMLATTDGILVAISSPHARKGILWDAFRKHYGPDGASDILVAKATSLEMNPTLKPSARERAFEEDPHRAAAEWDAEFRSDVETFVTHEIIDSCTDAGDLERPYIAHFGYTAFVDPSGGSSDSMTLAIAHVEEAIAVLDLVLEVQPPFSPADVVEQFAGRMKDYKISRCWGDRYGAAWVSEQFQLNGINYEHCEQPKSELYASLLPMLNSRTVALVDNQRLRRQLLGLERRTGRGGRDVIDHVRGAHDDVANAAAGALTLAKLEPTAASIPGFNRKLDLQPWGVA